MANVMLEVKDLTTKYITRFREDVYAVDHVSLKVEEGKSLGIAGRIRLRQVDAGAQPDGLLLPAAALYQRRDHHRWAEYLRDGPG